MDQTTQSTPAPQVAPTAQAAATPAATSSINRQAIPPKNGSHKGLFLALGIVALLTFIGGAAYLLLQNESTSEVSQVQIQSTKKRYSTPSPTVVQIEGTVKEVEAIMVDGTDDVTEIQAEIDQL